MVFNWCVQFFLVGRWCCSCCLFVIFLIPFALHFSRSQIYSKDDEVPKTQTNPKLISFYDSYSYCFSNSVGKLKSFSFCGHCC